MVVQSQQMHAGQQESGTVDGPRPLRTYGAEDFDPREAARDPERSIFQESAKRSRLALADDQLDQS